MNVIAALSFMELMIDKKTIKIALYSHLILTLADHITYATNNTF